jgi:hypothetical protein
MKPNSLVHLIKKPKVGQIETEMAKGTSLGADLAAGLKL